MKTGLNLVELAHQLQSQAESRKDLLAPQGRMTAVPVEQDIVLDGLNGDPVPLTNHAHGQMADHLGIPSRYYKRMQAEKPDLLARNVNAWLQAEPEEKRLVRVIHGRAAGVLSAKFRPLDNYPLAAAVLPTLLEKKVQVISAQVTETRLYIKGILPGLSAPLPEGLVWGSGHTDITKVAPGLVLPPDQIIETRGRGLLVAAITISNSEVGAGTLRIEPSMFTTWCTNMAILVKAAMKKYHVGRAWEADDNFEVFEDDTRKADDEAFFLKVRDVTRAAFSEEGFAAALDQIKAAGQREITSKSLDKVVDVTIRQLALPVSTKDNILSLLTRGGDLSQWGLSSAITAVANSTESYETATQLEYAGGQVLALPPAQWDAIAAA